MPNSPLFLPQVARCFVDSCNRNTNNNVTEDLTTQMNKLGPCAHIKAAIECSQEAQPLTLKNSILNTLQVCGQRYLKD